MPSPSAGSPRTTTSRRWPSTGTSRTKISSSTASPNGSSPWSTYPPSRRGALGDRRLAVALNAFLAVLREHPNVARSAADASARLGSRPPGRRTHPQPPARRRVLARRCGRGRLVPALRDHGACHRRARPREDLGRRGSRRRRSDQARTPDVAGPRRPSPASSPPRTPLRTAAARTTTSRVASSCSSAGSCPWRDASSYGRRIPSSTICVTRSACASPSSPGRRARGSPSASSTSAGSRPGRTLPSATQASRSLATAAVTGA